MIKVCKKDGCDKPHLSRGYCSKHYYQEYNLERRKAGYFVARARTLTARYTTSRWAAKSRGLEWSIPFQEFVELVKRSCHYCGGELPKTRAGLDRKDNNIGYTLDNSVPCCAACNQLKSDIFTFEEFVEFASTDIFKKVLSRIHAARDFQANQRRKWNKVV